MRGPVRGDDCEVIPEDTSFNGGVTEEVAWFLMVVMRQGLPLKVGGVVNSVRMTGAINAGLPYHRPQGQGQEGARARRRL